MSEPDPLEILGGFIRPRPIGDEAEDWLRYQPESAGQLDAASLHRLFAEMAAPSWTREPGAELGVWFDRDGRPIGPVRHGFLVADDEYRCVAEHWVRGWRVSTVWTGMDGSPVPPSLRAEDWRPEVFETMLFAPEGWPVADDLPKDAAPGETRAVALALMDSRRISYPDADEAAEGHERTVHTVVALLGAHPWEVRTWQQESGTEWAVEAGGWRLVIRDGAIRGLARSALEVRVQPRWHPPMLNW